MDFSLFAQLLKPLLGKGLNQDEFVQSLFYAIVVFPNSESFVDPLENVKYSMYRLYFSGSRRINEIAYKICNYADREIFRDYVLKQNDEVQTQLCNAFKPYIRISKRNVPEKLADLFYEIIFNASKEKGKRKRIPKMKSNKFADTSEDVLQIKESLGEIIKELVKTGTNPKESERLKMHAVCVSNKITDSSILCESVTHYAVVYFKTIRKLFRNVSKSNSIDFDDVATAVKFEYKKLKNKGLSQDEIYNAMVQWICTKTNSTNITACSVIVSFFVQDCEVFDVVAK
ncbi:hypothetical protein SAMN05720487_108125 [Fibrobacter sp. UWT2]|uniref:ABC-three component system protein n=1 Tax=Fibrobacter sp. UWT2 TaxID=1896224 RepID=UPI00091D17B9|nr:ABC-three component system protein [Fibrobacter sp. UWT2]SHL14860.1 hypothetical protein SAMN05720487_108125 [Fibrobacter sp. UWT2]